MQMNTPEQQTPPSFDDFMKEIDDKINKKSGFFDLHISDRCLNPGHNPPSHLYIPAGKGYRHICPSCGKETVLRNSISH